VFPRVGTRGAAPPGLAALHRLRPVFSGPEPALVGLPGAFAPPDPAGRLGTPAQGRDAGDTPQSPFCRLGRGLDPAYPGNAHAVGVRQPEKSGLRRRSLRRAYALQPAPAPFPPGWAAQGGEGPGLRPPLLLPAGSGFRPPGCHFRALFRYPCGYHHRGAPARQAGPCPGAALPDPDDPPGLSGDPGSPLGGLSGAGH